MFSSTDFLTFWRFLATLDWRIRNLGAAVASQLVERNIQTASTIATMTDLLASMCPALQHAAARFRANMRVWPTIESIWTADYLTRVSPAVHFLLARPFALRRCRIHEIRVTIDHQIASSSAAAFHFQLNSARRALSFVTFFCTFVSANELLFAKTIASWNRIQT